MPSQKIQPASQPQHFYEFEKTLYLGDLSYFCTEDDLFHLFSPYGPLVAVKVHRGKTGNPLLHGFVSFQQEAHASLALAELSGVQFMGRVLR
jgi:RNA recognition motif-containing protein